MHPELIRLYNEELHHLRRETDEFAAECGTAASMLSLDKSRVADPYVERLLEGVAYLAARVRVKLDSQYPVFTQQLVEVLFPGWLAPCPPACILKLTPDLNDDKLPSGPIVARRSIVIGERVGTAGSKCEFETCRELRLWPLQVQSARYVASGPATTPPGSQSKTASVLRVELNLQGDADLSTLPVDALPFFVDLKKREETGLLMELVAGRCTGIGLSCQPGVSDSTYWLPGDAVRHLGFDHTDAMFPITDRGHLGFRVLREYAALPERFHFFEVSGLRSVFQRLSGKTVEFTFHFSTVERRLTNAVRTEGLALHCVPAVNLRQRDLDIIHIQPGQVEFAVNPATARDGREVVQIESVCGGGPGVERTFLPVFESVTKGQLTTGSYYALRREPRRVSPRKTEADSSAANDYAPEGPILNRQPTDRSDGHELYISLAEQGAGPHGSDLNSLAISALCMDRHAAAQLHGGTVRYRANGLPVRGIACVAGPSDPLDHAVDGIRPWQALSHLFVNHLSLKDGDARKGADALRAMLGLFVPSPTHFLADEAEALREVRVEQITRRLPQRGELAFARGVAIRLKMSRASFDAGSPFMLGAMLEHYLASHVSINTFAEVTLEMDDWTPLTWRRSPGVRPSF